MSMQRTVGRLLLRLAPQRSQALYTLCARYVDRYNGDNNADERTNGEYAFLRATLPGIPAGGVVFDVGANVGTWVASALQIRADLQYHCFEPSRTTFARLLERSLPANVRANNFGLGDETGSRDLHVVAAGSGMNSLYAREGVDGFAASTPERIELCTLDAYCAREGIERIDFLKVDVEGHELAVFRGATSMLAAGTIGLIQFEYGGCNLDARVTLADLWKLLASHGFKLHKLFPEGPRRINAYDQSLESFKYSNWIATSPSHPGFHSAG